MATKKSTPQMKVAKKKEDVITKKEYFESGKIFDNDSRQLSIKEAYQRVLDKEIKNYSSTGTYLKVKDLLSDLNDGEKFTRSCIFEIMDSAKKVLTEIKDYISKLQIEDLDFEKECLPNGKAAPKLKKDFFDKYNTNISMEDSPFTMAEKAIIAGIVQTYSGMLLEDAIKLSVLND